MNINNIHADLSTFYNMNYREFRLINPNFILSQSKLTWNHYLPKEAKENYDEYFQWILNNSQYSLQISDEALIQIFFDSDPKTKQIFRASLAFLPRPDFLMEYFRFDFDGKAKVDFTHNTYHINFGYRGSDLRFSLKRFPSPSEFLNLVLFLLGKKVVVNYGKANFYTDLDQLGEKYNHVFDFVIV